MSAGISRRMILWKIVSLAAIEILHSLFPIPCSRSSPSRHLAPASERVRQGAAVHVLQFAAQRHAVGEPAAAHAVLARELREGVRGRLAFDRVIGGNDQLDDLALCQAVAYPVHADFSRTNSVERAGERSEARSGGKEGGRA